MAAAAKQDTTPAQASVLDVDVVQQEPYVIYEIRTKIPVPSALEFDAVIRARYSDLLAFHERLCKELGNDPSQGAFPSKMWFGNHDEANIEDRRRSLARYFGRILKRETAVRSAAFAQLWKAENHPPPTAAPGR
eukprot:GABV01004895.1.p1 GENE.GABV01004895.1~~GABV01004895.1.p1  ORF type:complete len:134 (-),score=36.76 GABV01004895.1:17-418(-)